MGKHKPKKTKISDLCRKVSYKEQHEQRRQRRRNKKK